MAKINYNKLNIKPEIVESTINWNDETISVKHYLPIKDKLLFIISVIEKAADGNRFINPIKLDAFITLEIITSYTNIVFTDKQKEDPAKLYDAFITSGLSEKIISEIPVEEFSFLYDGVKKTIEEIYKYNNSAFGILDNIVQDYKEVDYDATNIKNSLSDPENLTLLKKIMAKLG